MHSRFAGMTVGVDVNRAVAVAMGVKMHAVAPKPPQHMGAETDQHDSDGGLERPGEMFGDGMPEQDRGAGKDEQRHGMAKPPGQAVLDDVADMAAPRGDRGHRGDVVSLERMLHPEEKAEP